MKLLRKDSDYALAAIAYLATQADGDRVSATELAGALNLPHGFLRKILKLLSHHGIVSSSSGKGGGFVLAADPDKLSVYSILKTIQGPIYGTECAVNREVCPNTGHCPVRRIMNDLGKKLENDLDRITISDLIKG